VRGEAPSARETTPPKVQISLVKEEAAVALVLQQAELLTPLEPNAITDDFSDLHLAKRTVKF
jgi:hypothetical protein